MSSLFSTFFTFSLHGLATQNLDIKAKANCRNCTTYIQEEGLMRQTKRKYTAFQDDQHTHTNDHRHCNQPNSPCP